MISANKGRLTGEPSRNECQQLGSPIHIDMAICDPICENLNIMAHIKIFIIKNLVQKYFHIILQVNLQRQ